MRVWDIHPGYLNRQSLLGEHRELHGIVSIIVNKKKGYARHPETLRWVDCGWALNLRHRLLAAEMSLRNFTDKSPVTTRKNKGMWPQTYIDSPFDQFAILCEKYRDKEPGRIGLPHTAQDIWAHHKYSVLARDPNLYKKIGRGVAQMSPAQDFKELAVLLTETSRTAPSAGGIRNALLHMWGYVSDYSDAPARHIETWSLNRLFNEMQAAALAAQQPYLMASTALTELKVWI